jgi:hypothetical protein
MGWIGGVGRRGGLLLGSFLLASVPAGVAEAPKKPFDVVSLADGVYGFVWRDALQEPVEGNALFIVNESDVVVGTPPSCRPPPG